MTKTPDWIEVIEGEARTAMAVSGLRRGGAGEKFDQSQGLTAGAEAQRVTPHKVILLRKGNICLENNILLRWMHYAV